MPIRINLLAEAQAAEEIRRKDPVKRVVWLAIVVVAVVLGWSLILQAKIMTDNSRLSGLKGALSSKTNQYTQILINRNRLNELNSKLVSLNRLATNRFLEGTVLDSLQHATVDGIQLIKLHIEQSFELVAEGKPVEGSRAPVKPATSTERIKLVLDARDISPNAGGEQIYKYKELLAHTAYFQDQHISTNEILLKDFAAPQLDNETGRPYVKFTLECRYPDRLR